MKPMRLRTGGFLLLFLMVFMAQCAPATIAPPPTVTGEPLLPAPTATAAATVTPDAQPVAAAGDFPPPDAVVEQAEVASPDGQVQATFYLVDGVPFYQVARAGVPLLRPSRLGLALRDAPPLGQNLSIVNPIHTSFDETWTQPWGEVKDIRNHYHELRLELAETAAPQRHFAIVFRVYDDGLGFRYELPEQEHLKDFEIIEEETEFVLAGDYTAWWIPAFEDNRYEYLYHSSPVSKLRVVHTPLTLETGDGLYLSLHEAALLHYPSMALRHTDGTALTSALFPWSDGSKAKATAPLVTPWRTLQIAETPGGLITSYLILNLNEPNKLDDISWIHPQKYIGIWWGMHIGKYTWGAGAQPGATTENTRAYLDFAVQHGFDGVLVEGWNQGWDGNWVLYGDRFSFTEPYPDFDLPALAAYAKEKGVRLIGHHETGAAVQNYEAQLGAAFALYQSLGIDTVKTGYVGYGQGVKRRDAAGKLVGLEWHHGQFMVEHHQKVVETAAQYHIMINIHEPIKDTGLRRTYPNLLTREGARGQEYNAWDDAGGNPPDHTTILPFTRMLAGPMDYTPGIFNLLFDEYRDRNRVNSTLAKELALYVVLYSPLQMAADLPEHYEGQPAFQFILDVPVDWADTQVLDGVIGDYITTVRKDRHSDDWYLSSITDEAARTLFAPLSFLDADKTYVAESYTDAADADWKTNPYAIVITQTLVTRDTTLQLELAPGGGAAIRFRPATEADLDAAPN